MGSTKHVVSLEQANTLKFFVGTEVCCESGVLGRSRGWENNYKFSYLLRLHDCTVP